MARWVTVFRGDDSLDEDGHGGDALQPLDVLPAQGAVDLAGDVRRQPGVIGLQPIEMVSKICTGDFGKPWNGGRNEGRRGNCPGPRRGVSTVSAMALNPAFSALLTSCSTTFLSLYTCKSNTRRRPWRIAGNRT